jgi:hypothetical protein
MARRRKAAHDGQAIREAVSGVSLDVSGMESYRALMKKGADARAWRRWRLRQELRLHLQHNLKALAGLRQDNQRFLEERGVAPEPFSFSVQTPLESSVWGAQMALLALDELATVLDRTKKSADVQKAVYFTLLACGATGDSLQLVIKDEDRRRTSRQTATKQGEDKCNALVPRKAWVNKQARDILQKDAELRALSKGWKQVVAQQVAALSRKLPEGKQLFDGISNRFRVIYRDDLDEEALRTEFGAPQKPKRARRRV